MQQDQRRALVLLVGQVLDQLDEITNLKSQGLKANLSTLLLNDMGAVLKELNPELQEYYFDTLVAFTNKRAIPKVKVSEQYAELSAPSKRRLISSIREDLKLAAN